MSQYITFISDPILIWLLAGFLLLLLELKFPGLIIAFFGLGAWVVAVVCVFSEISFSGQILVFLFSSLLLLAVFHNVFKRVVLGPLKTKPVDHTDQKVFVGHNAVVKEIITPQKAGKVEFNGLIWHAESDEPLAVGKNVEILEKRNLTLIVRGSP